MTLDPNRWTLKATEAFSAATELGRSASHPEIVPEHLLLALLGQEEGIVLPLLHRVEVDIVAARNEAELVLDKLPNAYGSEPQLSRALRNVFDKADQVREDLTDEYLSTEHLLLALHGQCKGLGGVDHETLLTALREVREVIASPARTRRISTRRSSGSVSTSPSGPARANSIR